MTPDEYAAIVIGRNEGDRLIDCLSSLQSTVDFIVYVDSGSTDGSVSAAERLGATVLALDMTQPFTAARARNEGFALLRKLRPNIEFVQFIDGDCILDKNWMKLATDFIAVRDDVAVVGGRRRERYPTATLYNRLCDIEWNTPIGQALACGGDSLVRVSAFEALGGFAGQLIGGEESELCVRLREKGWKIWRLDAEMTRHDAALNRFGQWWRRATRFGYAIVEVSRLHWHSPCAVWKTELRRAVLWGAALPAIISLSILVNPAALAAMLIYPFQVCKIAVARGATSSDSWLFASFVTLAKFAEFQGVLMFYWRRLKRRPVEWIEYK